MRAMAHSSRDTAYDTMQRKAPYRKAGADVFARLRPEDSARRLVQRLERLGYPVTLQSPSPPAMS